MSIPRSVELAHIVDEIVVSPSSPVLLTQQPMRTLFWEHLSTQQAKPHTEVEIAKQAHADRVEPKLSNISVQASEVIQIWDTRPSDPVEEFEVVHKIIFLPFLFCLGAVPSTATNLLTKTTLHLHNANTQRIQPTKLCIHISISLSFQSQFSYWRVYYISQECRDTTNSGMQISRNHMLPARAPLPDKHCDSQWSIYWISGAYCSCSNNAPEAPPNFLQF